MNESDLIIINDVVNPIWLTISEAAKLGGVSNKTIRRAIQAHEIPYKIIKNKYYINLRSLINYLYSNTKLKNKINFTGIGQYIEKWRK